MTEITNKEQLLRQINQIKSKLRKTADGTDPRVKGQIEKTASDESEVITSTLTMQVISIMTSS